MVVSIEFQSLIKKIYLFTSKIIFDSCLYLWIKSSRLRNSQNIAVLTKSYLFYALILIYGRLIYNFVMSSLPLLSIIFYSMNFQSCSLYLLLVVNCKRGSEFKLCPSLLRSHLFKCPWGRHESISYLPFLEGYLRLSRYSRQLG